MQNLCIVLGVTHEKAKPIYEKIKEGAECLSQFHKYNIKNNEWEKILLKGNPPIPVFGCSSVIRGNKDDLYGGSRTDESNLNQFHRFDCGNINLLIYFFSL